MVSMSEGKASKTRRCRDVARALVDLGKIVSVTGSSACASLRPTVPLALLIKTNIMAQIDNSAIFG
jgi:hypothetical protein